MVRAAAKAGGRCRLSCKLKSMAFTVSDFQDLMRLLREHPEWKAELRQQILDEEFLRLPEYVRQNSADRVEIEIECGEDYRPIAI